MYKRRLHRPVVALACELVNTLLKSGTCSSLLASIVPRLLQDQCICSVVRQVRPSPNVSTIPITAMGFSAMVTFQLDNTKR